jgi:Tfp pilus assembly protein PilV
MEKINELTKTDLVCYKCNTGLVWFGTIIYANRFTQWTLTYQLHQLCSPSQDVSVRRRRRFKTELPYSGSWERRQVSQDGGTNFPLYRHSRRKRRNQSGGSSTERCTRSEITYLCVSVSQSRETISPISAGNSSVSSSCDELVSFLKNRSVSFHNVRI